LDCGGLPLALHHLSVLVSKIYFDEYKKTLALGTVKSVGNYMSASNIVAGQGTLYLYHPLYPCLINSSCMVVRLCPVLVKCVNLLLT
jgi:hypothetical protein